MQQYTACWIPFSLHVISVAKLLAVWRRQAGVIAVVQRMENTSKEACCSDKCCTILIIGEGPVKGDDGCYDLTIHDYRLYGKWYMYMRHYSEYVQYEFAISVLNGFIRFTKPMRKRKELVDHTMGFCLFAQLCQRPAVCQLKQFKSSMYLIMYPIMSYQIL